MSRVAIPWWVAIVMAGWGALPGFASGTTLTPPLGGTARLEAPAPLAMEHAFRKPKIQEVVLSPRGDRVAYLLRGDRLQEVWVYDPQSGERILRTESRRVDGIAWATDGSGLFLETPGRIAFLPVLEGRPTFVFELDPRLEQSYRGVDPASPHHVLVAEKRGRRDFGLLRVAVDGTTESLFTAESPIFRYLFDDAGTIAFVTLADEDHLVVAQVLATGRKEILRCAFLDACQPVARTEDGSGLVVRIRAGADLEGLYRLDLESGQLVLLHQDPTGRADLASVTVDPIDGSPVTTGYYTDRFRQYPIEDRLRAEFSRLETMLAGAAVSVGVRRQGPFWLVEETGPQVHHPRYWLFDRRAGTLRPLLEEERLQGNPLVESHLSPTHFVTYESSDGLEIPGFVTLPLGVEPATAPLVALVHGGPWTQVLPTFSGLRQVLASRGYIVFEPNYRASTGYGLRHVMAARGEFGDGRVHQDIIEGVDALLDLGLGDRDRVGIVGHSFGGFSVLGALAFSPEHFAVGVASAPPIDLLRSLDQIDPSFTLTHGLKQREILERLLVDREQPEAFETLQRKSPEAHLAETARPLLILAGGKDAKVDIVEVKHYATELQNLGKDVSLFVDPDSGHSFVDPRLRRAWLFLTETVLARYLGGEVGSPPDARHEGYLRRNLLIVGDSLRSTPEASD
ncbi:MAG: alpha/beta fold hydrolase [Thermoanaerobaculia bacterium]|nr:alpha/beta fold hydrolase [Thermoanaerobaculia bacterium]